jgi:hypothetical protein
MVNISKIKVQRGDRGTAYPSAVETASGKILFVSGQGADASIATFDPDWLMETRLDSRQEKNSLKSPWHLTDSGYRIVHFPMAGKGRLRVDIQGSGLTSDLRASLTDHYSIPADTAAIDASPVVFRLLGPSANRQRNRLVIRWNTASGMVRIRKDGRQSGIVITSQIMPESGGFNYFRINGELLDFYFKKL